MLELDAHMQAATCFFQQASKKFELDLHEVNEIYKNFEVFRKIFRMFGFPNFGMYSEVLRELKRRGATDLEFNNPASLFSNFVEFVVLGVEFHGCAGLEGLGIFVGDAYEYTMQTLELCLKQCFPNASLEEAMLLLRDCSSALDGVFLPVFDLSSEISIFYYICFLYWFMCTKGPVTFKKIVDTVREESRAASSKHSKRVDAEIRNMQNYIRYVYEQTGQITGEDDAACFESFEALQGSCADESIVAKIQPYFEAHAESQWHFFYLANLEAANAFLPYSADETIRQLAGLVVERNRGFDLIVRQLVNNMLAAKVLQSSHTLLTRATPNVQDLDGEPLLSAKQIEDYFAGGIMSRIKQRYISQLTATTIELLGKHCKRDVQLPISGGDSNEHIFADMYALLQRYLTQEQALAAYRFSGEILSFYRNLLLDVVRKPVRIEVKRAVCRCFLANEQTNRILLESIYSTTERERLRYEFQEAVQICERQTDESISEDVAYLIQYENKAAQVHDTLIVYFLALVALTKNGETENQQIDDGEADIKAVFERKYLLATPERLEQLANDFYGTCFAGSRVLAVEYFTGVSYQQGYIDKQLDVLQQLYVKMLGVGVEPPANHLSLGFLDIISRCNANLCKAVLEAREGFASIHEKHEHLASEFRTLAMQIIGALKDAQETVNDVENQLATEIDCASVAWCYKRIIENEQILSPNSQLNRDFLALFELVFLDFLTQGYFSPSAYAFCLSLALELRDYWNALGAKQTTLRSTCDNMHQAISELKGVLDEVKPFLQDTVAFCAKVREFDAISSSDAAWIYRNEVLNGQSDSFSISSEYMKSLQEKYDRVSGIRQIKELISSVGCYINNRFLHFDAAIKEVLYPLLAAEDDFAKSVVIYYKLRAQNYAAAAQNGDESIELTMEDLDYLANEIQSIQTCVSSLSILEPEAASEIDKNAFILLSQINKTDACLAILCSNTEASAAAGSKGSKRRYTPFATTATALATVEHAFPRVCKKSAVAEVLKNVQKRIYKRDELADRIYQLKYTAENLRKYIYQMQSNAVSSMRYQSRFEEGEALLKNDIAALKASVGHFDDPAQITMTYTPLQYLFDCIAKYKRQYDIYCKLEYKNGSELSQGQQLMFKGIQERLSDFVHRLYRISEIGLEIKQKKNPSGDEILIIKQIIQYIPFLQEFCEALRNLSTKSTVDSQLKQIFYQYNVQFQPLLVSVKPNNYDHLQKAIQNFNQIKMFTAVSFGQVSGIVQQYLTEDVRHEFNTQKLVACIHPKDIEQCRYLLVKDYAIFGLSEVINRHARREQQFNIYYDNVCEFCYKDFPQIIARTTAAEGDSDDYVQPIYLNEEIYQLQARTAHLQYTALVFDRRCEESINKLLLGATGAQTGGSLKNANEIQIATLEHYERRMQYAAVCGCAGYPRYLILCFQALQESQKHVENNHSRKKSIEQQRVYEERERFRQFASQFEAYYERFYDLEQSQVLQENELRDLQNLAIRAASALFSMLSNQTLLQSQDCCKELCDNAEKLDVMCQHMQLYNDQYLRMKSAGTMAVGQIYEQTHAVFGQAVRAVINALILNIHDVKTDIPYFNVTSDVQYISMYQRYFQFCNEYVSNSLPRHREFRDDESHLRQLAASVYSFLDKLFENYAHNSAQTVDEIISMIISRKEYHEIYQLLKLFVKYQAELVYGADYQLQRLIDLQNSQLLEENVHFSIFKSTYDRFLRVQCIAKSVRLLVQQYVSQESDFEEIYRSKELIKSILAHHQKRFNTADADIAAAKQVITRVLMNIRRFVEVTLYNMANKMSQQAEIFSDGCANIYQIYQQAFGISLQIMHIYGRFAGTYAVNLQDFARLLSNFELLAETPEAYQSLNSASSVSVVPLQNAVIKAFFVAHVFQKAMLPSFKMPPLPTFEFPYRLSGKCYCNDLYFLLEKCGEATYHFSEQYCAEFQQNHDIYCSLLEQQRKLGAQNLMDKNGLETLKAKWKLLENEPYCKIYEFKQELVRFVEANSLLHYTVFKQQYIDQLYTFVEALLQFSFGVELSIIRGKQREFREQVEQFVADWVYLLQDELLNNKQPQDAPLLKVLLYNERIRFTHQIKNDFSKIDDQLNQICGEIISYNAKNISSFSLVQIPAAYRTFAEPVNYRSVFEASQLILDRFASNLEMAVAQSEKCVEKAFTDPYFFAAIGARQYGIKASAVDSSVAQVEWVTSLCSLLRAKATEYQERYQRIYSYLEIKAGFLKELDYFYKDKDQFLQALVVLAVKARCAQCLSGHTDHADDALFVYLHSYLAEFSQQKQRLEALVVQFDDLEVIESQLDALDVVKNTPFSFASSLDSEYLVNAARAALEIYDQDPTFLEKRVQEFKEGVHSSRTYNGMLKYLEDLASCLFQLSITYTSSDSFGNTNFSKQVFLPGFLSSQSAPLDSQCLIQAFETAIRHATQLYCQYLTATARPPHAISQIAEIEPSGQFLFEYFYNSLQTMRMDLEKLHFEPFGLNLLCSVRHIIYCRRLNEFLQQLAQSIEGRTQQFSKQLQIKFDLDLVEHFSEAQLTSLRSQISSLQPQIEAVSRVLEDYEQLPEQLDQLARTALGQFTQIAYFSAARDVLTGYAVAMAGYERGFHLLQLEAQTRQRPGIAFEPGVEEHFYMATAAEMAGDLLGCITSAQEASLIDNFAVPLFRVRTTQYPLPTERNHAVLSQSAFSGALGALARNPQVTSFEASDAEYNFVENATLLRQMLRECGTIKALHEAALQQLQAATEKSVYYMLRRCTQTLFDRMFDSLLLQVQKWMQSEGPDDVQASIAYFASKETFERLLGWQTAQDMMAHLYVVCDKSVRFVERREEVEGIIKRIYEWMAAIQLIKRRAKSETLLEAFLANKT